MNPNTTVITLIVNGLYIPIRRQRLPDYQEIKPEKYKHQGLKVKGRKRFIL